MEKETIALIELGGSHDECLYSQVLFLKAYGHAVHVILFDDHLSRMEPYHEVEAWKTFQTPGGWLAEWTLVFRLLRYLKRQGIQKAVLNTAEGNLVRKLSLAAGRHTEFTGIMHLSSKLWTSRSQQIISRKVRKEFVLADFIRDNLEKAGTRYSIDSFYPIYFPAPKAEAAPGQEYRICIPGAVDLARRDYHSLLDEMLTGDVPSGVRFVLLGRTSSQDGMALTDRIGKLGLGEHFILFHDFIPHSQFYAQLQQAWIVLPLITPRCKDYDDYRAYKITGTFNLAYGFRLPMLQHESFSDKRIYRKTSVFYREGGMMLAIHHCLRNPVMLDRLKNGMADLPEFRFEVQAEKYIRFIYGNRHSRP